MNSVIKDTTESRLDGFLCWLGGMLALPRHVPFRTVKNVLCIGYYIGYLHHFDSWATNSIMLSSLKNTETIFWFIHMLFMKLDRSCEVSCNNWCNQTSELMKKVG
jgi:hypothetical protein